MSEQLQKELDTFNKLLPTLSDREGKYALIIGTDLVGTYDSYADALSSGYEKAGLDPFLVKRISATESVSYFTRDMGVSCHILAV